MKGNFKSVLHQVTQTTPTVLWNAADAGCRRVRSRPPACTNQLSLPCLNSVGVSLVLVLKI